VDARAIVTGKHRYSYDMTRPGMLYAGSSGNPRFIRSSRPSTLKSRSRWPGSPWYNDGDFIGVTSADPQKLAAAAEAIKAEWKTEQQPGARDLFTYLKSHPAEANRGPARRAPPAPSTKAIRNSDGKPRPPTPSPTSRTSRWNLAQRSRME